MRALGNYIRRHWRGELPLAQAFWLSFMLLSVIGYAIQSLTPELIAEPRLLLQVSLAEFVLFRLLVFPWQAVGVLRACEKATRDYVPFYWVRGAQAAVVMGIVWVVVDGLAVAHVHNVALDRANRQQSLETAKVRGYQIGAPASPALIEVRGSLDPGVTRDLRAYLDQRPGALAVVLDSDGGSIFEGRGLARLIAERGLDTYTLAGCESACTTAFMGGQRRWLGPRARLGFHQYVLEARNVLPNLDSDRELRTDFEQFARRGVDTARLGQALATPAHEMWYPSQELLLETGVIHGVARPPGM